MMRLATMVIVTNGEKVLFLERHKQNDNVHKDGMHIPMGGKVEKGESIEDCIKREAFEESGLMLNSVTLKGIIYFRDFGEGMDDWIDYIFESSDFSGEPKDGYEGNFVWATKEEFKNLNLYEGDKIFLDYIFNKNYNFFAVEFLYDKFELKETKLLYHS